MSASMCLPGPTDMLKLLEEWQKPERLEVFRAALSSEDGTAADPNHFYDFPLYMSLLDKACELDRSGHFVRALLEAGADPNKHNSVREAKTPLHFAAKARNAAALRELLARKDTDVNALDDTGNNVLHVLCKKYKHTDKVEDEAEAEARDVTEVKNCLDVIRNRPPQMNHKNHEEHTPMYIAAAEKRSEIERILRETFVVQVDVDTSVEELQVLLKNKEVDRFLKLFNTKKETESGKSWRNANDGMYTFLQKAINGRPYEKNLIRIVEALLDNGADPSHTSPGFLVLPAQIAARNGDSEVLNLLCDKDAKITVHDEQSALHDVIERADQNTSTNKYEDYKECFNILIKYINENDPNDINSQDRNGNTPLHLAVRYGNEYFILELLKKGAYIGMKNNSGEPPIADISRHTFMKFLDSRVTDEKFPSEYKVMFDVKFLKPQDKSISICDSNSAKSPDESIPLRDRNSFKIRISGNRESSNPTEYECAPLLYISKVKDLRPVLNHPVFTSFLEIKWSGIRHLFWINLCFYILFVFALTFYILFYYESPSMGDLTKYDNSSIDLTKPSSDSRLNNTTENDPASEISNSIGCTVSWIIVVALFILLVLREVFQLIVASDIYICSPENYLEILLLVSCGLLLFLPSAGPEFRTHLSAFAILLSWAELVLLIGRHPLLSTYIEMLKKVSKDFLCFLAWYSLLIIAFALSFYSLFRNDTKKDNFFLDPGSSLFKTVVMVTGEFEVGEIPFETFSGTSHIVFVIFVFLVAIVLFNLLNGLAVSDTQAIRENAELVAIVSRINFVCYTEKILLSHSFWRDCFFFQTFAYLQKLCLGSLTNQGNTVTFEVTDGKISILPFQVGEISCSPCSRKVNSNDGCCRFLNYCYYMDKSIIKAADKILQSRRNHPCSDGCIHSDRIAQLEVKLEDLNKISQKNQAKLEDLNKTTQKNQEMLQNILQLLENTYNSQLIKDENDIRL